MKQFFKFMFASMLGVILASLVLTFISFLVIAALISSAGKETVSVKEQSILEIKFDYPIKERTQQNPLEDFDFSFTKPGPGLNDILNDIDKAKRDERIRGIFLNLSSFSGGFATVEEIRNALLDFKKSEKFIYAYSEFFTQGTYYLASVSDSVFLHPQGGFDMRGLRAELMFFKGSLEKLNIEPQVIRHGKFKSAVEPYVNEKMSAENREQLSMLIHTAWDNYTTRIAESRKIEVSEVKDIAANLKIKFPEDAVTYKMVDKLAYYDEVLALLKKASGLKEDDKLRTITLKKYDKASVPSPGFSEKKKIAVIYAVGPIGGGEGGENSIGSDKISAAIRKARLDSTIKAIVLRVNSPGGSALASDVIWREMVLAKKAKPVVVSMGDVAASGGYYISCAADTIVAQPNTITGSIGVFGLLFNTQKFFSDKLGVTFDTVKTGRFSTLGSPYRALTAEEKDIIQQEVERIYEVFISLVADGRGMDKAKVDEIGQGRVWLGTDAKRLGLVDVLGGINTAAEIAAKMAKVEKYRTVSLPEQEEFLKKLMEDFSADMKARVTEAALGESYSYYKNLQSVMNEQGILARMPYEVDMR